MIDDTHSNHTIPFHIYLLFIALSIQCGLPIILFLFIYYLQIFKYSFVFADSVSAVALSTLFISYIDTLSAVPKSDLKMEKWKKI